MTGYTKLTLDTQGPRIFETNTRYSWVCIKDF